jgi:hypothetical protein
LPAAETYERPRQFAVAWRTGDGAACSGKLEVGRDELVLKGAATHEGLHIPLVDVSSVEISRVPADRVNGQRSLVVERESSSERVLIAALGGIGLLGELNDLLARLRAEPTGRVCVAVVAPIREGTANVARALVEEGPPLDVHQLELQRHHVFVSEREVVFIFEGEDAATAVNVLSRSPGVLQAAARWRRILAEPPRLAEEKFFWTSTS